MSSCCEASPGHDRGSRLRVLFVSGVSIGGAPRSTIELARRLAVRGHEVAVIVGDRDLAPRWYQLGVRLAVKAGHGVLSRGVRSVLRRVGRRMVPINGSGVSVSRAPLAANAYRSVLDDQVVDIVVANSLPREEMQWIADDLAARATGFGIYLREEHAVTHFTITGLRPDLAVSNAEEWADRIVHLLPCPVIPSVVDTTLSSVASTRDTVLLVNPGSSEGVDLLIETARLCPELPFVLQESWPLTGRARSELLDAIEQLPNVELRGPVDRPSSVYRDARVLLALTSFGRPRVVLEAQHNGIPVVALDHPVLVEAVGAGGVVVPRPTSPEALAQTIREVCAEPAYSKLVVASSHHARRPEVDPDRLVRRFEDEVRKAMAKP